MSTSIAEAKQFLVDRIAAEAESEGAPLDEVEKELLCWGEAEGGLKIAERARVAGAKGTTKNMRAGSRGWPRLSTSATWKPGRKAQWDEALDELVAEDLYLFVMLERAGLVKTTSHLAMPEWRMMAGFVPPLISVALAIVVAVTPLGRWLIPNLAIRIAVAVVLLLAPLALGRMRGRRAS